MSLSVQSYAANREGAATQCVLIHGWGMSGVIWTQWLALIREHCHVTVIDLPGYGFSEPCNYSNLSSLLTDCIEGLPTRAVYIGYSLGGMLALNIAKCFPRRVQAVVTLASNLRFVANDQWPIAMPQNVFELFYKNVQKNPHKAIKRFESLQINGTKEKRTLLKRQRSITDSTTPSVGTLLESLDLLATMDNQSLISFLDVPVLHLFGENDQLVPVEVATILRNKFNQNTNIVNGAPHNLLISEPHQSWNLIHTFLCQEKVLSNNKKKNLDKKQVARSFSCAASTYDSVADLQRRVGHKLQSYLPKSPADVVLDLGCGTGFFSDQLRQHYPKGQIIGLDLAEGMVRFASTHHCMSYSTWLCGDAENIPLKDNSVDIIFSSLAIQWCEDYSALFTNIARVLKPGGSFVVSTLGPDTLFELRQAWSNVDDYTHVNQFEEQALLLSCAQQAGLIDAIDQHPVCEKVYFDEEHITLEYDTLKNLTRELKSLGAHNVNNGRPSGLMGKQRMRAFKKAYESLRNEQHLLPASYQVWYSVWSKPEMTAR